MVMYWYRCISGIYDPVTRCNLLDTDVSAHFCLICPLRGKECKDPVWFNDMKEDSLKKLFDKLSSVE
ncbi:hypothetical protein EYM_07845 [Ignicoccus islandicus DSM 13165]|uniref:Uncharacterized protein n=1 Tax=Ignicoccus islandicus DSM 13165 TaxID=940295 RepID=A0A0U2MA88_9CREN|nr:hypothetical protein [Ignicoccus islandicus]ALU12077.1 hypothetical protein EYM_07845 [Ignicoccus islandicus DSM 13165]